MKNLIHNNFLLENKYAELLYHEYAKTLPIIDYHNHLSPKAIAEDQRFENITEVWIAGDHYKWRAMRTLGINEKYITGDSSDEEKFNHWAKTLPFTLRNPLHHWSQLELARYFNEFELLTPDNAQRIYQDTKAQIQTANFSARNLLTQMNVKVLCTTEDPIDTLEHHQQLIKSNFTVKVSTAFRPDKSILIRNPDYNDYIDLLSIAARIEISDYDDLLQALEKRISFFHDNRCRLSDHGLTHVPYKITDRATVKKIFAKRRAGKKVSPLEEEQFQTAILLFLGEQYHKKGWVQQFHLGAMRNNNTRMLLQLGPDTGWDSIGNYPIAHDLSRFLDQLDTHNQLSKTILYNLNPSDNEMMATMIGNFNDGSLKGKIQWGSGWWFLDQLDGMTNQINTLSNMGLISCFIGMLTDSRSFLSFPRHEYFRRLLCNIFGNEIEKGILPNDPKWIGKIISDISFYNAKEYFNY
ncbi:MAG: glucuronate isomerase [Flavobacteriaceae bacterium]|nr:glucuronate isomerase [Flavobacteriaceae bacterium]